MFSITRVCGRAASPYALACVAAWALAGAAFAQTPITLAEALERAQASSPVVGVANAQVDAARARERQAGAGANPELSYQIENFRGDGALRGMDNAETTIGVSQLIELGGKRNARRETAGRQTEATAVRAQIARADLDQAVREAFAELGAAEERRDLVRAAAQRAQTLSALAQTLVEAGREPPLRLLRAQAATAQAQAQLSAADADVSIARRALSALWGGEEIVAAVGPWVFQRPEEADAPAPDQTLAYRLARAEHASAEAALRLEQANSWIDVTVDAGVRQFRATDEQAFVAGVRIPIPLRNRNGGAIAAARAEDRAAELQLNIALADAVRRINDASAAFDAADARARVLDGDAARQAEEVLELARIGYEAGRFQLIDVIDAEDAFASIRNAAIDARLARARAAAALTRAQAR